MNYARPLNLSPCTTGGSSIPLQDAEGKFTGMNLRETSMIASPCCAPLLHTSLPAESTSWTEANNQE